MESAGLGSINRENIILPRRASICQNEEIPIDTKDSFEAGKPGKSLDMRKVAQTLLSDKPIDKIEVAWKFESGDGIATDPVVNSKGVIFAGNYSGRVFAIDSRNGAKLWARKTAKSMDDANISEGNGSIFLVHGRSSVTELDEKTGRKKWEINLDRDKYGDMAYCAANHKGEIYLLTNRMVIALDEKTKKELWKKEVGTTFGLPAFNIGIDGNLIIASQSIKVRALDRRNGEELWSHKIKAIIDRPAVTPDGTVYFGSMARDVRALDGKSGEEIWKIDVGMSGPMSVALGPADNLYVMNNFRKVFVLERHKGGIRWEQSIVEPLTNNPLVDQKGTLYFISKDHTLNTLDGASGKPLWEQKIELVASCDPVFASGTFVQGDVDGVLYGLREKDHLKEMVSSAPVDQGGKEKSIKDSGEGFIEIDGIKLPVKDSAGKKEAGR